MVERIHGRPVDPPTDVSGTVPPSMDGIRVRGLTAVLTIALLGIVAYGFVDARVADPAIRWLFFGLMVAGVTLAGSIGLLVIRPVIREAEGRLREAELEKRALQREARERIEEVETYAHELEQTNEDLRRFANVASHDLKEPVRMISSYAQLLEQRYADELDEEAEEYIAYAVEGAHRLWDLIDGLLAYARVGDAEPSFETVELDDALDDALHHLEHRIEETDAAIHRQPLPDVRGDETQLSRVFQNLISNAIRFSGDDRPRIEIWAEEHDDQWLVNVRDHGVGFDSDREHRIFEIFQRAHHREEGQGVGLAVCQRIVDRHRGTIQAEACPGEGATFRFTLPSAETDTEPRDAGPRPPPATLAERWEEVV